ncbi:tyrosine-type recombinase/integrase [Tenacibaculum ascidiaceicola]
MNKMKKSTSNYVDFTNYLQTLGYTERTTYTKLREAITFTNWCNSQGNTVYAITYHNCLQYINHLKKKKNSKSTINAKLAHLRTYFTHLVNQGHRKDNPIENTTIKGVTEPLSYTILDTEELEDLYYSFETDNTYNTYRRLTTKRNKIIVGLMVYQGLNTSDLKALLVEHVQLSKGKIYVPACNRGNARSLELKSWQMMELMEYLNEIQPLLLTKAKKPLHYHQLFPFGNQFNLVGELLKKLKKYNQKVTSIKQIRASVITHWLKQYNLRKVQYLAGHRHISSTERYLQDDLENLHDIVNNFHPIS